MKNIKNKNGVNRSYYKSGQINEQFNLFGGKLFGLHECWHENGQLKSKGNFHMGVKTGLHQEWDVNGNLLKEERFKEKESVSEDFENEKNNNRALYLENKIKLRKVTWPIHLVTFVIMWINIINSGPPIVYLLLIIFDPLAIFLLKKVLFSSGYLKK